MLFLTRTFTLTLFFAITPFFASAASEPLIDWGASPDEAHESMLKDESETRESVTPKPQKEKTKPKAEKEKSEEDSPKTPYTLQPIESRDTRPLGKDDTASATKIKGETIRKSAKPTALEAIGEQAGDVYVSGSGTGIHGVANGASGSIHIRGMGGSPNSQVLVVEDGIPDMQGIFGHPMPDSYTPFLIDEVRVIKGGDSVLYGSNAMGGVVVIRNRWRKKQGFELMNDIAYGSFNTIRETAAMLGHWGRFDIAGGVHILHTDGHRKGAGGTNFVAQANTAVEIAERLTLTLHEKVMHVKGEDAGAVTHPNNGHWFDVWRNNLNLALSLRRDIWSMELKPYYNFGIHTLYDGFRSFDYTTGAIAEFGVQPIENIDITLGLNLDHVDGEVENRIDCEKLPVEGITSFAAYQQVQFTAFDAVTLVGGMREVYSSAYGFVFLFKAGARYEFYEGLRLRARYVRNYRNPTIRERYLPFPSANPDLKPEYADNLDFGFEAEIPHFEASVTGFRNHAQNLIKYFGVWPTAEVVNIDDYTVWGVEGSFALKELGPFSLRAAASWQDVGRYTKQNPNVKTNAQMTLAHDFSGHYFEGVIGGEYIHGLYMNNYSRDEIDDVYSIDITLRYRYTEKKRNIEIEPYIHLRNILDHRYAYVLDYPMTGFNVLGGLKARI